MGTHREAKIKRACIYVYIHIHVYVCKVFTINLLLNMYRLYYRLTGYTASIPKVVSDRFLSGIGRMPHPVGVVSRWSGGRDTGL